MWDKRSDMVVHQQDPYNAEPPRAALAGEVFTRVDTFYSRNHGPIQQIDPDGWRLSVDGLVRRPLSLSLEDLRGGFAEHELPATLQCAGNRREGFLPIRDIPGEAPWGSGATSTARWAGARLADVLAAAGPRVGAAHAAFSAPDVSQIAHPVQPYGSSIPLAKALGLEVLLAWSMNGAPLTAAHGAPLRVVVPGFIGARSVKWLQAVTVGDRPSDNWFQATAYRVLPAGADPLAAGPGDGISLAEVALNAEILSPDVGATVAAGPVDVRGYAFAGGGRGVARVDVSTDDGISWVQADLGGDRGPWVWRQWTAQVVLPQGERLLTARAWDTAGASMPEDPRHLWNPKGYVNNSWARVPVTAR